MSVTNKVKLTRNIPPRLFEIEDVYKLISDSVNLDEFEYHGYATFAGIKAAESQSQFALSSIFGPVSDDSLPLSIESSRDIAYSINCLAQLHFADCPASRLAVWQVIFSRLANRAHRRQSHLYFDACKTKLNNSSPRQGASVPLNLRPAWDTLCEYDDDVAELRNINFPDLYPHLYRSLQRDDVSWLQVPGSHGRVSQVDLCATAPPDVSDEPSTRYVRTLVEQDVTTGDSGPLVDTLPPAVSLSVSVPDVSLSQSLDKMTDVAAVAAALSVFGSVIPPGSGPNWLAWRSGEKAGQWRTRCGALGDEWKCALLWRINDMSHRNVLGRAYRKLLK